MANRKIIIALFLTLGSTGSFASYDVKVEKERLKK